MNMLPVRTKDRQTPHAAARNGQKHIDDGQCQNEKWGHQRGGHGAFMRTEQRKQTNLKAEKISAAIAEINPGRRKVKPQEP